MSNPNVKFSRSMWLEAYDLLDHVNTRNKLQWAMSLILAASSLAMVIITGHDNFNFVPIIWTITTIFWLCTAVFISKSVKSIERVLQMKKKNSGVSATRYWPEA